MASLPVLRVALAALVALASAEARADPIGVGNFVWNDYDDDGVQDVGEPGIAGVTVELWDGARTQLLASTTTNASGLYSLQAPGPGDYCVRVLPPLGTDNFSLPNVGSDTADSDVIDTGALRGFTDVYSLASNVVFNNTIDAGIVRQPIALGDRVWNDYDLDGVQDAVEPGLNGYVVELWTADRALKIAATGTDANGLYSLGAPGPGSYRIRIAKGALDNYSPQDAGGDDALDSDVNATGADAGYTAIVDVTGPSTSIDAGILRQPITLGNFVWSDGNRNGVQDAGEPGIAGVTVQLWNEPRTVLLREATTSASGLYSFTAPGPANYSVRVVLPNAGDAFAPKDSPPADQTDSDINPTGALFGYTDIFQLAPNVISNSTIDAGIVTALLSRDGFE